MSFSHFTRFLASGRSVMGLKKQPGPYRMNEESALPRFEPPQRLAAAVGNADVHRPAEGLAATEGKANPLTDAPKRPCVTGNSTTVLGRLARVLAPWKWRRHEHPAGGGIRKRPVQTEFSLERVKVVRNDLSDSDFGICANKTTPRQPLGMVWNRLSARLLRQAAQEFNVAQKQRGKLLSQAGHGTGNPRGA